MSVLSDISLRIMLDTGRLVVEPLAENAVQPSSIDLRLGSLLRIATPDGYRDHDLIKDGAYRLERHTFLLAATLEWVGLSDDLVGVLVGKSTPARKGIQIESAGYVDPGWRGNLTLELVHLSPLPAMLTYSQPIAQLRLHRLSTRCERPYGSPGLGSHYQESSGPVLPVGVTV